MDIAAVTQQLRNTHPELAEQLKRARGTLVETVEMKRRIVENLRPSLLDNLGLCAAIESYCQEFSRLSQVRCDCNVAAEIEGLSRNSGDLSIALFRIVQESLTNIRKYAKASRVTVTLSRSAEGLMLRIIDDGVGIAPDTIIKPMSHGLLGMRERALQLGGMMNIRRGRNDTGTCIEVAIPLRGADAATPPSEPPTHERRTVNQNMTPTILPPAISDVISSALHPGADGQTPSSQPYSTHPHTPPSLTDQAQ
jgi:signal transduction histidine kinase